MLDQIEPITCLQSDHPFVALLDADDDRRAVAVAAMIRAVSGPQTLVIHVENRRKVPFTLDRLRNALAEARGQAHPPARSDIRHLCHPIGDETRIVLILEQAETLVPASLVALQAAALEGARYFYPLQVVFAGDPAFLSRLRRPELSVMRYTLDDGAEELATAAEGSAFEAGWPPQAGPADPADYLPRTRTAPQATIWLASVLSLSVLASLVVWRMSAGEAATPMLTAAAASRQAALPTTVSALAPPAPPVSVPSIAMADPVPAAPVPEPVVPMAASPTLDTPPDAVPPAVTPATLSPEQRAARLRAEFDAFLLRSGQVAGLTEVRRQALFDEFQLWRAKQPPRRSVEPASTRPR